MESAPAIGFEMSDLRDKILNGLNDAQRAAVLHDGGPLLILAGAGSGKTKTATARVARLICDGVPPQRICVLTFTNKAAGEIRERISHVCGSLAERITAGTFHSIAARLLRERPASVGLRPGFTIYDEDDSRSLFRALVRADDPDAESDDIKSAYSLLSGARDRGISPMDFARARRIQNTPEAKLAARYHDDYVRRLQESGAVDFPGLLLHLRTIRDAFAHRWEHIIVDEYQDTNAVQDEIVTAFSRVSRNLCAVGDEQQSIYGFRGAQIENILSFPQRWGTDARIVALTDNYRSRPEILTPANAILRFADGYGKRLSAARESGGKVVPWAAENEFDEAQRIVRKVSELFRRGIAYGKQAMIYRTNAQSRVLEQECNRASIPYRIVGGLSFWERAEVKDCLAYLRLVHNRADDVAFRRVCNVPRRGLGEIALKIIEQASVALPPEQVTLSSLFATHDRSQPCTEQMMAALFEDDEQPAPVSTPSQLSLWDASARARLKGTAALGLQAFRAAIDGAERFLRGAGDIQRVLSCLLESIDYQAYLDLDRETAEDRRANVQQLLDLCADYSDISAFLEHAALSAEAAQDKGGDRVTLCTIHGSKGLEWEIVFAPGWEQALFPSPRAVAEGTLAEERRLAYVCITRARDMIFISGAKKRRKSESRPSAFLKEAGLVIKGWSDQDEQE
jgi:DNA helicase-2/ATP-dependent DNA helicase PcrA